MGGDSNAKLVENIMRDIKINNPTLKTGWYSGRSEISKCIDLSLFDYIKVGPYMHDRGGLSNPNTNQIMYKIRHQNNKDELVDITNKFWKKSL